METVVSLSEDDPDGDGCTIDDVGSGSCGEGVCCVDATETLIASHDLYVADNWVDYYGIPIFVSRDSVDEGDGLSVGKTIAEGIDGYFAWFAALRFPASSVSESDADSLSLCLFQDTDNHRLDDDITIWAYPITCEYMPGQKAWGTEYEHFPEQCQVDQYHPII